MSETDEIHEHDIPVDENLDEEVDPLVIGCRDTLLSIMKEKEKKDWKDFNSRERQDIAIKLAKEIVFKDTEFMNPEWMTKPDWFFNGVTVIVKNHEEYPTNLGEPFVQKWHHLCYFDGHTGRLTKLERISGWPT
jgi:hypothetical protein